MVHNVKSMTRRSQQKNENLWAKIFCRYFNLKHDTDHIISSQNSANLNMADVDVYLESLSGVHSPMFLQLTRDDKFENGNKPRDVVFIPDNTLKAIKRKKTKYTEQNKNYSKITLLIQGSRSWQEINIDFTLSFFHNIEQVGVGFNAIYYMSPPSIGGVLGEKNSSEGWKIIPLHLNKDLPS